MDKNQEKMAMQTEKWEKKDYKNQKKREFFKKT